jgi:hypothetical protein|tara:strand:- start:453 stop:851 length:399 start_codon:yes stop_codon:yes gene_type:complete
MGIHNVKDKSPIFSDGVYAPEELLSEWLTVVFACMTTSLLFYHMTRVKSLTMDPRLSAFFACSLIIVSILYNFSAIFPYMKRMNHQLGKVKDDDTRYQLNRLKFTFISLAMITTSIQLGICYVILKNTGKYM